jgi:hypothetical protein
MVSERSDGVNREPGGNFSPADGKQKFNPLSVAKRLGFTKSALDKLLRARPHRQYSIWDAHKDGSRLCVLVSRGAKHKRQATVTFRVVYYLKTEPGAPHYIKIGRYPDIDIDTARARARRIRIDTENGLDPRRPSASGGFAKIVEVFMEDHAKYNRSRKETQRIFDRYVLPEWGSKEISDIRRLDVTLLLAKIKSGKIKYKRKFIGTPRTASATLAQLSKLFNWHAVRSDEYVSPIVKGMLHRDDRAKARDRVLSDNELRILWPLLNDTYGAVLKCALLTAQRFHKVSGMRRADLKAHVTIPAHLVDGRRVEDLRIENVWDASRDDDPDNKQVSVVPLSSFARDAIASVPVIDSDDANGFVFSLNGREPIKGWSKLKNRLDGAMRNALREQSIDFRPWQHRDLRRTAKTLMMRAGVSRDISERCLAHEIGGVEGVYDKYDYLREKYDAFETLASVVGRIVNPPKDNVVPLPNKRSSAM